MSMKILIAIDFSLIGSKAAQAGYKLARYMGADVTFVHATPAYSSTLLHYNFRFFIEPDTQKTEDDVRAKAEEEIKKMIDDMKKEFGDLPEGCKCDVLVNAAETGADELLKVADEIKADLIVLGNSGGSTLERELLGSTALKVMNNAKCSMMLYSDDKDSTF